MAAGGLHLYGNIPSTKTPYATNHGNMHEINMAPCMLNMVHVKLTWANNPHPFYGSKQQIIGQ